MASGKVLIVLLSLASLALAADEAPNQQPNELNYQSTTESTPEGGSSAATIDIGSSSTTPVVPTPTTSGYSLPANSVTEVATRSPSSWNNEPDRQTDDFPFFGPPSFNRSPFMSMFGNIFEDMRRQREQMMKEFDELEPLAGEGSHDTYYQKNGVSYVKSCTVKRLN